MSLGITDTQYYTDIAAAIRAKNGEPATTKYAPAEMATAITDLPSGGGVQGDWLKIHSEEITVGQNSIAGSKDMVDYLKAAAAEFDEGYLIQFSVQGDPKVYKMYYYSDPSTVPFNYGWRYSNNKLSKTVCNNNSYDAYLPVGTRVVLYIAEEVAY